MNIIQAIAINSAGITETVYDGMDTSTDPIGTGLYPTYALLSHLCAHNSLTVFHANTVVIHALQTIKKGEEVTIERMAHAIYGFSERNDVGNFSDVSISIALVKHVLTTGLCSAL